MLLDYHSLYTREPEPTATPAWVLRPRKKRERQVVALSMDSALPAIEGHALARVRVRTFTDAALLMLVLDALMDSNNHGGWSNEVLLLVAAAVLLEDKEDDY